MSPIERTIPNLLAGAVEAAADSPWLFHEDAVFTYEEAWRRIGTVAAQLADLGIGRGDLVLATMRNTAGHLFTWLGLMRLGAVLVTANPAGSVAELGGLITQTEPKLVLGDDDVDRLLSAPDSDLPDSRARNQPTPPSSSPPRARPDGRSWSRRPTGPMSWPAKGSPGGWS